jgi:purine-binding chemotaxis protein CheW
MNDQSDATHAISEHRELAGKYMAFKLGSEEYGLGILKVRELIGLMDITRVPGTRDFIRGVINLRGKVIPVIDLRLKFGMTKTVDSDQTVIIVVQHSAGGVDLAMAIVVDEVLEVLDIGGDRIDPPPNFGSQTFSNEYILGIGKMEKRVVFLLDIDRILTAKEHSEAVSAS